MSALIRAFALVLAVGVIGTPLFVSLMVAGSDPGRPIHLSEVAPYALGGLVAGSSYLVALVIPRRLALAPFPVRFLVACFMVIPVAAIVYLITVTPSLAIVAFAFTALIGTLVIFSACVWPAWLARSNPSFQRTASPPLN